MHHYHRAFGRSQFFNFRRIFKTAIDVMRLWFALVILGRHRRGDQARRALHLESSEAAPPVSPASPPLDRLGAP